VKPEATVELRKNYRAPWIPILVAAIPVAVGVFRSLALPMNHDVGWLLHLSARALDGARLYVDLIEVNPPLIVWLGMPVIVLERVASVSHTVLYPILVGIGALLSLSACWRLMRGLIPDAHRPAVLGGLAVALFVIPSGDWGQREHLALIMVAPYLVACAARARRLEPGPYGVWLTGIAAGLGFALKPHFLLVAVALEGWLLVVRRAPAAIGLVLAGTIALYGATVLLLVPDYMRQMAEIGAIYTHYGTPLSWRTLIHWPSLLVAAALPLAFIRGEGRELRAVFGIACAAWLVVALVQGKGFFYHYLPGMGIASMLLILALIPLAKPGRIPRLAAATPLLLTFPVAAEALERPTGNPERWQRIDEVAAVAAGRPVLILSHSHRDSWPAVNYSGAIWTFSLPATWPARPEVGATGYAVPHTVRALAELPVVLVPRRPDHNPLPALLEDPHFRHAWDRFVPSDSLRHYQVFRPPAIGPG
jgi:hypothetical protein